MLMKLGFILAATLVVLALLSGNVFAQASSSQQVPAAQVCITNSLATGSFDSCITSAIDLAIIAMLLSFAIIALAYILGEVFDFAVLKGWYKTETWEVTKTIFVVVIIYSVISIFSSLGTGLSNAPGSSSPCPGQGIGTIYCFADNYLASQSTVTYAALGTMMGVSIGLQGVKSPTFMTYLPFVVPLPTRAGVFQLFSINAGSDENIFQSDVFETSIYAGSSFLKDTSNLLVIPMFIFVNAFYDVFYVIVFIGIGILIPIGIFFRAVPFLRGIGGMILALGIGTSLVLPMLLVVNSVLVNYFTPFYNTGSYNQLSSCGNLGFSLQGAAAAVCDTFQKFFDSVFNPVGLAAAGQLGTPAYNGYEAASSVLTSGGAPVVNVVMTYDMPVVFDFILLLLDLIVAWALLQGVARLLGGQLRLGIGKLTIA
ncbi:MAG: hypothetical protein LVQ95_01450 [Candidatus Micrarchaeales archaeon]|nr:hypothetical protein [Candidatus Micrarchaeales archaeon]